VAPPIDVEAALPDDVRAVLSRLWAAGRAAYLVGGAVRDLLLGRKPIDWDVATDALPDAVSALFPRSAVEARFGTVRVPTGDRVVEITTFRRDQRYGDHRRPDSVTFTDRLEDDLARRDFTVNALAWGRPGGPEGSAGRPRLVDPFGGRDDLDAGLVRSVGDPAKRFDEDALRLLRAVRLAAQLGFRLEEATRAALQAHAPDMRHVSAERIAEELRRILATPRPSDGLALLAETGLLEELLPELAAQQGVPQDKPIGGDLWRHTLATVDAAGAGGADEAVRLAALLHDIGKPRTLDEGHFHGHERIGAEMAADLLERLRFPSAVTARVRRLVRWHMFDYRPGWRDAAVRRFIRKIGVDLLDDLCRLREADDAGSGLPATAGHVVELRRRVAEQLERGAPLQLSDLAVDGDDLQRELGLAPGPLIGRLLNRLLESVVADPERNDRARLLADARTWTEQDADR
jgi:tRNA nucleotidyltransferase (CCA-adding enzyme)